jgi:tetratricopeptide (TPR) repeat protein
MGKTVRKNVMLLFYVCKLKYIIPFSETMKRIYLACLSVFLSYALSAQTAEQDSLLRLLKTNIPDTVRLRALTELTEITDDPNVWSKYNKQAKELAITLTSNPNPAVRRKANIALATAYNNEGLFYNLSGKASRAVEYLLKSLELREELGIKSDLSETSHNLGTLYYDIGEYKLAQQYFDRSLRLSEEINDSVNAAITRNYIGMIAIKDKEYTKALHSFEGTLSAFKNSGDYKNYATTLDNIGMAYYLLKEYDKALAVLYEAEKIQKEYNDPTILSSTFRSIGLVQFSKGNISVALHYGNLSLEQAKKSGFPKDIATAEELLTKVYAAKKDFTNAFYHYKNYNAFHDSIKDEEARKVAISEQLKSGYEQKAAAIKAEQEKKDALSKEKLSKKTILNNSLIAGLSLLILLSLVLYSRFRLKKKSNEKLEQAYADLKLTQQQLLHQEKMASLGQIAAGISHEIQNPLNFVNNFSAISAELIDEATNTSDVGEKNELLHDLKNNIDKISMHGNRASRIIRSILNQSHQSSNEKQLTDINQLCDEFMNLAYQGMRSNYPDFNCTIIKHFDPANPQILTAPQDIARVILNLFNNAFYAVHEKSLKLKAQGLKSDNE